MPLLDGRRESCSSKTNSSNCLFEKYAVTAACFCTAVSMPVLDGRRESCSSKTNSSNCLLKKIDSNWLLKQYLKYSAIGRLQAA